LLPRRSGLGREKAAAGAAALHRGGRAMGIGARILRKATGCFGPFEAQGKRDDRFCFFAGVIAKDAVIEERSFGRTWYWKASRLKA